MEQLLCGPGEVFGLEPAADEWAISECSEDVAVGGIGLLFTLCFLRRRRRVAQPQRAVETAADGSIYSALDGSEVFSAGFLPALAFACCTAGTLPSLRQFIKVSVAYADQPNTDMYANLLGPYTSKNCSAGRQLSCVNPSNF